MPRLHYLDRKDVEIIAHRLAAKLFADYGDPLPAFELFGGIRESGALLESALALPRQPYYPRLHDKAGALLRSLIKNHPLVDGNKRVGMATAFTFLVVNKQVLVASNQEMVAFALHIARSEPDISWQDVAQWLRARSVRRTTTDETVHRLVTMLPGEWDRKRLSLRMRQYAVALGEVATEMRDSPP